MNQFTIEERNALYALFSIDEHEVREGATNKTSGNITWFTYIRREAIQSRLDDLFFGEWELYFLDPANPFTYHKDHVDCAMGLSIRGIRREYSGSQEGGGLNGGKGASTDALKRVASMWGLGLYLQSSPVIRTKGYKDANNNTDWDKKTAMENEAMKQVEKWLKSLGAGGSTISSTKEESATPDPLALETHLGKPETPTSPSPVKDKWDTDVKKYTASFYTATPHQINSLKKAWDDGLISDKMPALNASSIMLLHRIEEDYKLSSDEAKSLISSALSMTLSEFLKKNRSDFAKAWQMILNYIAQAQQENQTIPF